MLRDLLRQEGRAMGRHQVAILCAAWGLRPYSLVTIGDLACALTLPPHHPDASGWRLVECLGYTYQVFVASVPFSAELGSRMHAGRADSENRIKELKADLSRTRSASSHSTPPTRPSDLTVRDLVLLIRSRFAAPVEERSEFLQRAAHRV